MAQITLLTGQERRRRWRDDERRQILAAAVEHLSAAGMSTPHIVALSHNA